MGLNYSVFESKWLLQGHKKLAITIMKSFKAVLELFVTQKEIAMLSIEKEPFIPQRMFCTKCMKLFRVDWLCMWFVVWMDLDYYKTTVATQKIEARLKLN